MSAENAGIRSMTNRNFGVAATLVLALVAALIVALFAASECS